LSVADYEILVLLSEQPECRLRMSELAVGVAHSKSRVSHQVRRLETAELVRRVSCPRDGRGVIAVLTDAGADLLRTAAVTHIAGVREHLVDLLGPAEQQTLTSVFERVIDRLQCGEGERPC
jgi:DNA-binding MarR family transcriptional regulator